MGSHSLLQRIFPRIDPGFLALQADSIPSEPPVPEVMLNMCSFLTSDEMDLTIVI